MTVATTVQQRVPRRLLEAALNTPWAITEEYLKLILSVITRADVPEELEAFVVAGDDDDDDERQLAVTPEGIAIISMQGPMFRHADMFTSISAASTYDGIGAQLNEALANPQVRGILFDIDSPGGEVHGISTLMDLIHSARGRKPMFGIIDGMGASAAYFIATSLDKVFATDTSIIGSLGVKMTATLPAPDEKRRTVVLVSSQSPKKAPPLDSKDGREEAQQVVDDLAAVFIAKAARNLGTTEANILENFGKGSVFVGARAADRGMVHGITTFSAAFDALCRKVGPKQASLFAVGAGSSNPDRQTDRSKRHAAIAAAFGTLGTEGNDFWASITDRIPGLNGIVAEDVTANHSWTSTSTHLSGSKIIPQEEKKMEQDTTGGTATAAGGAQAVAEKGDRTRINNILAIAKDAGCADLAIDWLAKEDISVEEAQSRIIRHLRSNPPAPIKTTETARVSGMVDREAAKPFAQLGEQLQAIAAAGRPENRIVDKRLLHLHEQAYGSLDAAASGMGTAAGGDGGFLIQTDFSTALLERASNESVLFQATRKIGISDPSDGLFAPYIDETSRADGQRWGGVQVYWAAEADAVTAKKPKIGEFELRLQELKGLMYATERLLRDASALTGIASEAFSEEFSYEIDNSIYRGSGVGKPLGILNSNALVTVAKETGQAAGSIVAENVIKMHARVWPKSYGNSVWLINVDTMPQLRTMSIAVGTGGQLVYTPAGALSAQPYGELNGRPVVPIEQASTVGTIGDIACVDLNQYVCITKDALRAAQSMHVRFIYDEMTFKWNYRINGAPRWRTTLTPANGSNTLSPFVALATRA